MLNRPGATRTTTALAFLLTLAACGGAPPGGAGSGAGQTATLLYWQAPTTLNPYMSGGEKESHAASLVIEPLAEYDENGELVPALAAGIPTLGNGGLSADLTAITWTLEPGVLWSDGTPLTADDVVFTWRYCTTPGGGCAQASHFEGVETVEALDAGTVRVTFDGPKPFPFGPFVSSLSPILQQAQFGECMGADAVQCSDENFRPVGTGPYRVVAFRTNDTVELERNPRYRGIDHGLPFFDEIVIKGGGDAAAAARSVLQLGEADYAWNLQVEPEILERMESRGSGHVVSAFSTSVEHLVLNQTNPDRALGELRSEYANGTNPHPFLTDPAVGRALSLAIDREALVTVGYGEGGRPTCNIWPAAPASRNNDECLEQDIGLANRLLDEAGIVDTDGDGIRERAGVPLRIVYQTSTNTVRQTTQELIKGWWAEIGVATELKNVDSSVFFGSDLASPDTYGKFYADIQMYTNMAAGRNAEAYLGQWRTDEIPGAANSFLGQNTGRFHSGELDALHSELQRTGDPEQRDALIVALNDLLVQSYSVIPLIYRGSVSAHGGDIQGIRMSAWDSELWNIETWTRSP